jgi:hypothetical protein
MLEFLKAIKEQKFDSISFLPGVKEDQVRVEGAEFKNPGDRIGGNDFGDMYHIVLFQLNEDGSPKNLDWFEGILGSPLEYISQLIPQNWFGLVAKKTTTSGKFVQEVFDKFSET